MLSVASRCMNHADGICALSSVTAVLRVVHDTHDDNLFSSSTYQPPGLFIALSEKAMFWNLCAVCRRFGIDGGPGPGG